MQTLTQYLHHSAAPGGLQQTLGEVAVACKDIAHRLQLGAMAGILGNAGANNVQGEQQKQLDVIANDLLKQRLLNCGAVRAIASEEEDESVAGNLCGDLLIAFDPLDGSSNIDINSMVGTIFSVYCSRASGPFHAAEFLRPGREQLAAGYVLYGPSVMLVLSLGQGVQMFTLDTRIGEFVLTARRATIPPETREFAINMSNRRHWAAPMQRYIADLLLGSTGPRGKNFNMRWVAAMVADVHRILCRGGLFSYPWDNRDPGKPGKLRLLYEANPMALLIEQAGGLASTDSEAILDLQPESLHQRVPVILGSRDEVTACLGYHRAPS